MTKFCPRKVRMNSPTTSTEQVLATASKGVSFTFSAGGSVPPPEFVLDGFAFFLAIHQARLLSAWALLSNIPTPFQTAGISRKKRILPMAFVLQAPHRY